MTTHDSLSTFGEYIKARREALGKSIRGLAAELEMTPAYLSDIEKGYRYAPEKHLEKIITALGISGEEINRFYDLAGQSRNNNYPDLTVYIGSSEKARIALRKARDIGISDSQWQEFIDTISQTQLHTNRQTG